MPVIRFLNIALSHATAALLAASLVASCVPSSDGSPATTRSPAAAADASVERVVLQAYRSIGDRHLNEPDFRKMSQETYKGFASADPALSLEPGDRSFTLMRDGRQVVSRPTPADPTDGRAWGGDAGRAVRRLDRRLAGAAADRARQP